MPSLDLRVLVLERWRRAWDDDWSQRSFVYGGGSGAVGRVALWQTANQLTSDPELYYDSSTNRLGIGTTTPSAPLTFANTLGRKINLYSAGAFHHGLEVQGGALLVFADSTAQVRLGNMAADGTTFTPRFDVLSTYAYSSVPLAVMWGTVAGYELITNRLYVAGVSRFNSFVGIGIDPGSTLDVNGDAYVRGGMGVQRAPDVANFALTTNGIHCHTYSRFESGVQVIGTFTVSGGSSLYGNNMLSGYLGVNGGIDTRWTMRLYGSLYTDSDVMIGTNLRVGSYLAPTNKLHVDPGGYTYIGNQTGIHTGPHANWSLIVGDTAGYSFYCTGVVDVASVNVRGGLTVYGSTALTGLTVNGGAMFNSTTSMVGELTTAASIHSSGTTSTGGDPIFKTFIRGTAAWAMMYLQAIHFTGNWAGLRMAADGAQYADFRLSGGGAYLSAGAWVDGPSDRTVKRNITPIDTPLERLAKLHGSHYERTDLTIQEGFPAPNPQEYGLLAQDVAEALPDAAFVHDYGEERGKLWNYYDRPVLALLVESVKALAQRVEALETS